ncbi:TnsD family Tn7-like transposition protein [Aquitalea pelogenes]|uniref:TnsD family Tn7-like transposition protein n=1 Tax=Aquitalea pelogenes TaxID=1293573 RepID=UPI0035B1345F
MRQLDFCPQPYPDETLFSLVSRYHRLTGFMSYRDTIELLFGTPAPLLHCSFPQHLHVASTALFPDKGISLVIDQLTIFPYFRPFLFAWQANKASAYLTGRQTGAIKTLLGMVASQVGAETLYRYCPVCLGADRRQYGQAYWHRSHQLPGVWVCPLHHLPLFEVDSTWMAGLPLRLVLPDETEPQNHAVPLPVTLSQRDSLSRLAELSAQILNSNLGVIPPQTWQRLYLQRVIDLGLARPTGRLHLAALHTYLMQAMMQFPTQHEFRGCLALAGELPSWLLMLLRKPRRSLHPLKHLLLAEGLGFSGEMLLQWVEAPRASRIVEPTSYRIQKDCRESDALLCQVLARTGGSLQQVAKLTGVSVTTLRLDAVRLGLPVKSRPKTLSPPVMSALEQDFLAGLSLSDIAVKEQLSLVSLYRVLRMQPLVATQWRALRATRERVERRQRFLDDLRHMPLRHSSEYQWLYKHDRDWLGQQVLDYGKVPRRRMARVDWEQRDRLLAQRVEKWSEARKYLGGRPIRVTLSLIGRELHVAALLDHFLDKLPLTREAIASVVESQQQFHCRRLVWARDQLSAKGVPVIRWRLLRQAGIRPTLSAEIQQFIKVLCQENV